MSLLNWVRRPDRYKVSVVVPVYNPGQHIHPLVESLKAQTLGPDEFEVVFVDDGSTDGTGQWLRRIASRNRNFVYMRIENSGWPGRPRNVGLDTARGDYVVFADNDDVIPTDGLERMHTYAAQHSSDVVIGREIGRGRVVSKEVFRRSLPDARLGTDPVLGILTPHKMYRRQLLLDHGIRFREGVFRLEDHLLNIQAYFAASRISIRADSPCYIWTKRADPDGSKNASYADWEPREYYGVSMDAIMQVVEDESPGAALRDKLFAHWYDTKMLMRLSDKRFLAYPPERRRTMYDAIRDVAVRRFGVAVDEHLPVRVRTRSALLRRNLFDDLLPLAEAEIGMGADITTTHVRASGRTVEVDVVMRFRRADGSDVLFRRDGARVLYVPPCPLPSNVVTPEVLDVSKDLAAATFDLLVKDRSAPEDYFAPVTGSVALEPRGEDDLFRLVARGTGTVDLETMRAGRPAKDIVDVYARAWFGGWSLIRRVPVPEAMAPGSELARGSGGARAYATEKGNLSIRPGVAIS